ncbi:hypothetical protein JDS99_29160 [Bacillus cereus group sp. N6]|uniref:hypothetical protein n=1 Tax=Bacillus cereus group sp. N6 TaxID=2794583 RepID=UPI0018F3AF6B|nr:hypothetical protein [Bacillus cereus group sp. N6]MBJ8113607.1 hypothetical protein [Bacillus cereus group sp. N6]
MLFKKIKLPIFCMVSTSYIMSPSIASAEEPIQYVTSILSQEKDYPKSTTKRVKKNLDYYKDISSPENGNVSLPETGEKTTIESDMDKYVYVDVIATKDFSAGSWGPTGGPGTIFEDAIFVDKNLKPLPKVNNTYYLKNTTDIRSGELLGKWAFPKDLAVVQGTKSVTDYYYTRIDAQRLNKTSAYSFNLDNTVGVSQEEAFTVGQTLGLDFEIGYKHAFQVGGNGMWQTTQTLGTTLLKQDSIRREFTMPQAVYNYGYSYFWAGVYQATMDVSIKPSEKLQELINNYNRITSGGNQLETRIDVIKKQTQKLNIFHTVRTKGSGNPEAAQQVEE